jgi:hypothetical protein
MGCKRHLDDSFIAASVVISLPKTEGHLMSKHPKVRWHGDLSEEDRRALDRWLRVNLAIGFIGFAALVGFAAAGGWSSKGHALHQQPEQALLDRR